MPKIDVAAHRGSELHRAIRRPSTHDREGPLPQAARRCRRPDAVRREPLPACAGLRLLAAALARGRRTSSSTCFEGEAVLIEDERRDSAEAPAMSATFKAGVANGHHIVNRSDRDALFLEIGTRSLNGRGEYSDIDMQVVTKDGSFALPAQRRHALLKARHELREFPRRDGRRRHRARHLGHAGPLDERLHRKGDGRA